MSDDIDPSWAPPKPKINPPSPRASPPPKPSDFPSPPKSSPPWTPKQPTAPKTIASTSPKESSARPASSTQHSQPPTTELRRPSSFLDRYPASGQAAISAALLLPQLAVYGILSASKFSNRYQLATAWGVFSLIYGLYFVVILVHITREGTVEITVFPVLTR